MIDRPIMDSVIRVAESSPSKKRVGAMLLKKNKIVATGVNKETKTHPLQAKFAELVGLHEKIYLHAEMSALIKNRADADTIIVARLGGHSGDELRNARPCPVCSLALKEAGIKHIYYSTDEGFLYQYHK